MTVCLQNISRTAPSIRAFSKDAHYGLLYFATRFSPILIGLNCSCSVSTIHRGIFRWCTLYNNYSTSPSWIWSDKITNERVARVGYNQGEWNNCFSKFSNRVLPPIFISTILQSVRKKNLAHYFPYDVKLGLLAHSRSFFSQSKS